MTFPDLTIKSFSDIEETTGKLRFQAIENKLMHSVLENEDNIIKEGKILYESFNIPLSSFTPDLVFENIVKNFSVAENLYGKKLIRLLTGFDSSALRKNINIPEFQKQLRTNIENNAKGLKENGLIDSDYNVTKAGLELASLVAYIKELENITPKGILGTHISKRKSHYGERTEDKIFHKGDRYKDIAIKYSIKTAIRRGHKDLDIEDLRTSELRDRGETYIIYALDASGSMKGDKLDSAKKAGIALSFKAIENKDKVGLIVFNKEIEKVISPTSDFTKILTSIVSVKPLNQTEFTKSIKKAIELFPKEHVTKHLILLTDALPTTGNEPEEDTIKAVSEASARKITVSLIGLNLDKTGSALAKKIVEIGKGRLYRVKDITSLDKIMLEEYSCLN